ncbi:MAG TPA: aminoglycoside phosphotransferase family protein [Kofleriaceae bacterium]|nr:aminoglycoside phosphotransferase family protein [Kofleriaceae bacterium]
MQDPRIFPLLEVSHAELEALAGLPIRRVEPVHGGFTNTLHRVTVETGELLVVKHFAGGGQAYRDELRILRALGGLLPVPEIVRSDDAKHVIVYRWIEGTTLDECRRCESADAFGSLAGPLGRLLAWLGRVAPLDRDAHWTAGPLVARARVLLSDSRARHRMGDPLAQALLHAYDALGDRLAFGMPCLSHGDLGGRNILVQHAGGERWRIGGIIDWEIAGTGSPLVDIGSLFRYAPRFEPAFVRAFAAGYREADGELPDDWYLLARLLDAVRMIDILDENRELPGVFADCRMLLAHLAHDLRTRFAVRA